MAPLLLVVHGRAGGEIPADLLTLKGELARLRRAPVLLQALTDPVPPELPAGGGGTPAVPVQLVPLFLFPGAHVRQDVPAIAGAWRRRGVVLRRLPFLGAWPAWLSALAEEVRQGRTDPAAPVTRLLHHPLGGALAERYLKHLEAVTGGRCLPTPYSSPDLEERILPLSGPILPLALAANRLTDALGPQAGGALLARPRLRRVLVELLEALP